MNTEFEKNLLGKIKDYRLKEYIKERRAEWTDKTYISVLATLVGFQEFIYGLSPENPKQLDQATTEDIRAYRDYRLNGLGASPNTVRTYMHSVQRFYNHLYGFESPRNPMTRLEPIKVPEKATVYLTEKELEQLFEAAKENDRMFAMVKTLYYSGLRISELVSIRKKDVDFVNGNIKVMSNKEGRERYQPIPSECVAALQKYCGGFLPDQLIFDIHTSTAQSDMRKLAKKADIAKDVTPHTLRHTYARYLRKSKVDIVTIQKLLGHKNLNTTARYLHIADEDLNKTVEDVFGSKVN